MLTAKELGKLINLVRNETHFMNQDIENSEGKMPTLTAILTVGLKENEILIEKLETMLNAL